MKVLDKVWFSSPKVNGTMGLIAIENDVGEVKFRLGVGHGYDEDEDAKSIVDWGAKIDPDYVKDFFDRNLKKTNDEG